MRTLFIAAMAISLVVSASAGVVRSSSDQTEQVFLTIYNDNLALVREVREVELPEGVFDLEFADVAAQIDPTTVHITSLSHEGGLGVLEQNFEYDLLSPDRLLENFIGRTVNFTSRSSTDPATQVRRSGTLLSVQGGRIIESDGEIVINPAGELSVEADTGDLRAEPTLVWLLQSTVDGTQTIEASYLTHGISWDADYVAVIDNNDASMDLTGWVTIDNQSGATYSDASLKLVAGEVNRVQQPEMYYEAVPMRAGVAMDMQQFQEESFFEYHLYSLQRPSTIRDRQTKQMTLLSADNVAVQRQYIFRSPQMSTWYRAVGQTGEPQHVNVVMEFDNSEDNNMGMALPKGTVRMYRADSDGALQFIGEDSIDHTPRDETIRLDVGEAFDIVAERVQKDFRELMGRRSEQDWEITIRNHKDEDVTVTVAEQAYGDWTIVHASNDHEQISASEFDFNVDVPAHGETVVTYTIRFQED